MLQCCLATPSSVLGRCSERLSSRGSPLGGNSISLSGITLNQLTWTAPNVVYNFDVQAGFSYWFTPNWALRASYRLDAFIDPLRVAPDDGATRTDIGPGRSMDRYYHGPKLAVQARF
jgi:hypothetical protein